jgi:hypothetical protein
MKPRGPQDVPPVIVRHSGDQSAAQLVSSASEDREAE